MESLRSFAMKIQKRNLLIFNDSVYFFLIGIVISLIVVYFSVRFISNYIVNTMKDAAYKSLAVVEDYTNPEIISKHINNTETKTFTLLPLSNEYWIGQGFIEGTLYYIFRVKEETSKQGYIIAPVTNSKLIYNGKNTVEVVKQDITLNYKSKVDGQIKKQNIEEYHYVFYLSDTKIKDYGVIKERISYNSAAVSFPMFIPFWFPLFVK
ncbi:hypothetical protein SAMN04244560_00344 [Thermoanaerobacter thermohydrosulfuricus]|uniref:Uncharacterized protein n=2 Tax=Thermoanaerobacter thermohydrosulfuricus TaxID=1516 RepID=A0A1G7IVL3_THETY|nr:hypothetical protein SAMN04244560_00344 [Thermoanaerobacter thermohydrosulfuricus]